MSDDVFRSYRSDEPLFSDPKFQRRVLAVFRPIAIVENMHEVGLECGHVPLLMGDAPPAVGDLCFCPSCYEEANAE